MRLGAEEGAAGVVEDYFGVVVEKDGALVEIGPRSVRMVISSCALLHRGLYRLSKRPIWSSEGLYDVGSGKSKFIVYSVCRRKYASPATCSRAPGLKS